MMLLLLLFPMAFVPLHTAQVIGGREAPLGSRPYMAYVQIGSKGSCGGFLIREDVVVTAAHCNCNLGNIYVYLGVQDFMKPGQIWQRIRARRWIQHPDFSNENFDNDIMLLKSLRHPIALPPVTSHCCSPCANPASDRLQEAEQEVVSDSVCGEWYQHYDPTTMLCAGSPHAKKSAFQDAVHGGPPEEEGVIPGEIIGGREARPHARPYMAFVKIEREGKGGNMCGGFLTGEDVVVTAAHCNCNFGKGMQEPLPLSQPAPFPGTRDKAELTQTVSTILLSQKKVKKGDVCSVAGWGQISIKTNTQPSPTLQEVELMITARCMYLSQPYLHYIPSRMLCMGDPQERKSPFLLRDKAKLTQTVGTISLSQKKVKKGAVCSVAG
ncbi:Duodenase-1 [Chelonia mydas]|uniref:Duodenase-1 n=1 Tax=Chelonia mydas TaxID=8469 RepID=M7BF43_CHEMY|nr:Duodenase-1 [Chelonia mydas]